MSAFSGESGSGGGGGAGAFFRRLGKGIESAVNRPVPGLIKLTKPLGHADGGAVASSSSTSETSSKGTLPISSGGSFATGAAAGTSAPKQYRITQFETILNSENVDLAQLRKLSWNGVPNQYRSTVWQLLLGYMPTNRGRRDHAIARKRQEYADSIPVYFNVSDADRTTQEGEILRQIKVDLPRTSPDTPFFQQKPVQEAMERILYMWAIRHPASGYVQGMNDLLTPLLYISMYPFAHDVMRCDVATLGPEAMMSVEADAYWCLTKLLDNIQDHYTFSQPGLQRMVLRLEDLIHRIDNELHQKFDSEGLQYMQFSFRWYVYHYSMHACATSSCMLVCSLLTYAS
jgi:hypothetical protein